MKLFTKPGCDKCDYVKKFINKESEVKTYDIATSEGLAELAYYELVGVAEKELPILLKDGRTITGAINVRKILQNYC